MTDTIAAEALKTYERFGCYPQRDRHGNKDMVRSGRLLYRRRSVHRTPAWGRIDGREAIREFFEASMAGLTGHGWSTPENWTMAQGPRLVSQWDQVLGHRDDGTPWMVPGLSILYYAGADLFCYSHDMLNMTHIGQTMRDMAVEAHSAFQ